VNDVWCTGGIHSLRSSPYTLTPLHPDKLTPEGAQKPDLPNNSIDLPRLWLSITRRRRLLTLQVYHVSRTLVPIRLRSDHEKYAFRHTKHDNLCSREAHHIAAIQLQYAGVVHVVGSGHNGSRLVFYMFIECADAARCTTESIEQTRTSTYLGPEGYLDHLTSFLCNMIAANKGRGRIPGTSSALDHPSLI